MKVSPSILHASTYPSSVVQPLPDVRELLLGALDERWTTFRNTLGHSQKKNSEESVHDLCVAIRRLLSMIYLLASVHPEHNLHNVRRMLKRYLDAFSPLRDVQVQMLAIDKMRSSFPELEGFYNYLEKDERQLRQGIKTTVKRMKIGKIGKAVRTTSTQVGVLLDTPERQQGIRAAALHAVEAAFQRVVERQLCINPDDSTTIHHTRVAFKKFRYMVEALAPVLAGVSPRRLKVMSAFQTKMGDIQDAEVLLGNMRAFVRKQWRGNEIAPARILEELSQRRSVLTEDFLASAKTLYTFWRPPS